MALIYKITNTINKKVYIGLTHRSLKERYNGRKWHTSNRINKLVKAGIKKYGPDAFIIEIVETCTSEIVEEREKYYIQLHNSISPNGYNLTGGGEINKSLSEETRKLISSKLKGKIPYNKGMPMSEERKKRHSETMKGRVAWNKGKKTMPKSREAIEKSAKGHQKSISCFDLNGNLIKEYQSLKETKTDGFNPCIVCLVCKGKCKTHKGLIFKYK